MAKSIVHSSRMSYICSSPNLKPIKQWQQEHDSPRAFAQALAFAHGKQKNVKQHDEQSLQQPQRPDSISPVWQALV